MNFDLNGVQAAFGTFFGGNGESGIIETNEEDVSIWEGYNKTDSSYSTDDDKENDKDKNYLESTFDDIANKSPEAQGLVESFKGFLEGLFEGVKEQFGIEWSFDDFTEETLGNSGDNDGLMSGVKELIKTFVTAFGVKIGDNSSEKTSKKV